jgi:hypothetical protein
MPNLLVSLSLSLERRKQLSLLSSRKWPCTEVAGVDEVRSLLIHFYVRLGSTLVFILGRFSGGRGRGGGGGGYRGGGGGGYGGGGGGRW